MRLAPRLFLTLGLVATVSTAGLGVLEREDRRRGETERFERDVRSACDRVSAEVKRQADADLKLVDGACQAGEIVDETLLAIESEQLAFQRASLGQRIPRAREAFGLDGLVLATGGGEPLGVDPRDLLALPRATLAADLAEDPSHFLDAKGSAVVSRCVRKTGRASVGLVGRRALDPLLDRVGRTVSVGVKRGGASNNASVAEATCEIDDGHAKVPIVVTKSKAELDETLARVDRQALVAFGLSAGLALIAAMLLARSLGRPISDLAREAQKVASGEAKPIRVAGSDEIAELVRAFDKMIEDLGSTRRRLAATTRVAAWREVARRVAHEVKNPLAPIRTAVETLRRLRARDDPAFDEYFDEATRTVLDEVHRISNIVTEFTRFARLPPPKPKPVDLVELARSVVKLHEAGGAVRLEAREAKLEAKVDRDQIVQVLTNLVQNAQDAIKGRADGEVTVVVARDGAEHASVLVRDNGPGIAPEIAQRLFEPYATNKPQGTGLGLAIAQRIAMEHQGELSHAARPSGGAEFRLLLPLEGPPPVSEMQPPSSE